MWNERRAVTSIQLSRQGLTMTLCELNFALLNRDVASYTNTKPIFPMPSKTNQWKPKVLLFLTLKSHLHTWCDTNLHLCHRVVFTEAVSQRARNVTPNLLHKSSVPVMAQTGHSIHAVLKASPTSPSASLKLAKSAVCQVWWGSKQVREGKRSHIYVVSSRHPAPLVSASVFVLLEWTEPCQEVCRRLHPSHPVCAWHSRCTLAQMEAAAAALRAGPRSPSSWALITAVCSYDSAQIALETFPGSTALECWAGGAEVAWADKSRNRRAQSNAVRVMYPCLSGQAEPFPTTHLHKKTALAIE